MGPSEAILAHEGRTACPNTHTHRTTRRKREVVTGDADWSVETAEEEAQLRRALDLNEGPELVGL